MVVGEWNSNQPEGARKRVYIPGYAGVVSRMNETIAGTFAQTSRDSHFLVYKGCKPAMDQPTLPSPDCFYQQTPNPRVKTNAANRSNFHLGDERDWGFETLNEAFYKVPTKIPPRHSSIVPGGRDCTKEELDKAYIVALTKIGVAGVKRLESSIRMKIEQRTSGGPMALRKAFKYFDSDASGDIDPDEFYAAMHAFGLEFTEDQVMALFGYYDVDRDGGLSYYEFIDKVLGDGFGGDSNAQPEYVVLMAMPQPSNKEADKMRTTIPKELVVESEVRKVFDRYDTNKSGEIDIRELSQMVGSLGLRISREEINNAMLDLDLDKSGAISFEEFWQWWQRASDRTNSVGRASKPPPLADQYKQASRTPNPLDSGLKALHERMSGSGKKRPKSRNGQWLAGSRPASSYAGTNLGRPISRNSMRSTLSMDFQHPPQLARPPKVHGFRRQAPRPHTAPVDPQASMYHSYIPMVGVQSSPSGRGTQTGFRL